MKKIAALTAAVMGAAVLSISTASAQEGWPTKPITLIVPFAPGGNTDLIARTIAPKLGEKLGQSVIVENRPGAGGTIATTELSTAAADGYTMQIGDISTHAISPHVYKSLTYDPIKDFDPVIQVTSVSLLMVVNPTVQANTVQELIDLAKADPESLSYASSGNGSPQHLAFEYFKSLAGIDPVHIPYNGSAPALTDVIAGHVPMMIDGTAVPHVKSGALRALAVTGTERSQALPDVPTMQEAGVKDFAFTSWHGIMYPAGVPSKIVDKVNSAVDEILKEQEIKDRFAELNIDLAGGSSEKFGEFIAAENTKMKSLIAAAGVTKD
ncbi:tripartite tricarboxylate transporter substrate binding protein [Pseudorhizobium endolithicum]|uniref:Tripartite tricarboxylate transporter substrate binding protein n=1 Tax=Pseudorhizobium endolithicum TaxID=1191678 RepID=A0ABN7JRK2_9HYPH|nr:tripartite tricarboxylate transporter substrate binding protein [Pseudorhizobium endolithicum]CAD7037526.1 tripartite tricarboxylate transporter substrate binding protein [Pseudorhizobium endolithicum]